jgi:hypothetical protein
VIVSFDLDSPHLWSPDDPFLYDLQVNLLRTNQVQDHMTELFGIRETDFKGSDYIINGKPTLLFGTHYLLRYPICGPIVPDQIIWNDFLMIKQIGMNCIYSTQQLPSIALSIADQVGICIIQMLEQNNLILSLKNISSHTSLIGLTILPEIDLSVIIPEIGSNIPIFRIQEQIKGDEKHNIFFKVKTEMDLDMLSSVSIPYLIWIEQHAIAGHFSTISPPFDFETEDFQAEYLRNGLKMVRARILKAGGIILNDFADENAEGNYKNPNLGLVSATRQPKKIYYALLYTK